MQSMTWIQILDEAVYISLCANALAESMNPPLLSHLAMGKYLGRHGSLVWVRQLI